MTDPISSETTPPELIQGDWQYTPPYDGFIFVPAWQFVTTWGLDRADQFRVRNAPPALDSRRYAIEHNEVKATGDINSSTRTADQTAYGDSRVQVGIHFRSAVDSGQRMGRKIGRHVYENLLRRHDGGHKHSD